MKDICRENLVIFLPVELFRPRVSKASRAMFTELIFEGERNVFSRRYLITETIVFILDF